VSRIGSSFSFAFRLTNFMVTRGGTAKSTSRITYRIFRTFNHYTRPAPQALGSGSTLLEDLNLKVREDAVDLSWLVNAISSLTVMESSELARMLQNRWKLSSSIPDSA
jgi:hypothetical protein